MSPACGSTYRAWDSVSKQLARCLGEDLFARDPPGIRGLVWFLGAGLGVQNGGSEQDGNMAPPVSQDRLLDQCEARVQPCSCDTKGQRAQCNFAKRPPRK